MAQYQTALDSITYSFTTNGDPTDGGTDTDPHHQLDGQRRRRCNSSGRATSTVTRARRRPVVVAGATASFTGGGAAVALDAGLTVSDVDSGGNLTGATVIDQRRLLQPAIR